MGDEDMGIPLFATPGHMWGPISIEQDRLTIRLLDDDWFKQAVQAGKNQLPSYFSRPEHEYLLTASTAELQAFARRIATEPKAFAVETILVRRK
jgi:hypothetical protein